MTGSTTNLNGLPTLRKAGLALGVLATLVSLVFAGGAFAAKGGNAANAKLCQQGGWHGLMDSATTPFSNEDQCVSYGAHGGAIYALASIDVELCASQAFDGICVSTSGFGLKPTTIVSTPLLKNGAPVLTDLLIVQAGGTVGAPPISFFEAPCVAGNVYSATGSGTSADSLSSPTMPGISITSNTISTGFSAVRQARARAQHGLSVFRAPGARPRPVARAAPAVLRRPARG